VVAGNGLVTGAAAINSIPWRCTLHVSVDRTQQEYDQHQQEDAQPQGGGGTDDHHLRPRVLMYSHTFIQKGEKAAPMAIPTMSSIMMLSL